MNHSLEEIVSVCELMVKDEKYILEVSDKYGIGETFAINGYQKNHMLHNRYYRYLASYCEMFKPESILEIGTQVGAGSSIFLANKNIKNIVSADVNNLEVSKKLYQDKRFYFRHLKNSEECSNWIFERFDLIFVDIGHDGIYEIQIHQKLLEQKYRGIVIWDDIELNENMKLFWNSIKEEKIETNWHDECGFGIVKYGE